MDKKIGKEITKKELKINKKIGWFFDKKLKIVKQVITIYPYKERIVGKLCR